MKTANQIAWRQHIRLRKDRSNKHYKTWWRHLKAETKRRRRQWEREKLHVGDWDRWINPTDQIYGNPYDYD